MAGQQPVAVYALRIPPGDIMVPAVPEFAAMFRVTMAAIDPSAEPEVEDVDEKKPRATLKIVRIADADLLDDEDDLEDYESADSASDDSSDDAEVNGGPSSKQSKLQKTIEAKGDANEDESDSDDSGDDAAAMAALQKAMRADKKGKAKALGGEAESDSDEDDEALELDECVVCTLDPERNYQQTLDLVVGEGEKVFFKVSGTHTIHLTGNYLLPLDDISDSEEDDEYEDDEELYGLDGVEDELDLLEDGDEESDELDDLEDPRIMEVDSEDGIAVKAERPAGKGKNKRAAADSDEEEGALDDILAKVMKKEEATPVAADESAKKLTKAEKKKQKKLKNNEGQAAAAPDQPKPATAAKVSQVNGTTPDSEKKKVQFAKNLEQGPTPSATKPEEKKIAPASGSIRNVQGVTVDDRKAGTGPAAKKGSKLELRYIGKLEDGKQFDANKSGKPFAVKLGSNEVIKGWEIGLQGISAGGERRITIPPGLAYGNKAIPGIPKNSKLIFDIKCLSVK